MIKPIHNQAINYVQDTFITVEKHKIEQVHIDKKQGKEREEQFTRCQLRCQVGHENKSKGFVIFSDSNYYTCQHSQVRQI